jgi:polysaccharide biosynthesis/export protein
MKNLCHSLVQIAVIVVLSTQLFAQTDDSRNRMSSQTIQSEKAAVANTAALVATAGDPSYLIGPEDVLEIEVWKEKELSGTVPVRPDGKISLPLLDDVQAAGLTAMQLSAGIKDKLKKYVAEPRVTVVVEQVNSRQVYVLGEVIRPGAFPLVPHMTVLQAIAKAGGLTQYAHKKKIRLKRFGDQTPQRFNYNDAIKGKSPDVDLEAGDTIIVQ